MVVTSLSLIVVMSMHPHRMVVIMDSETMGVISHFSIMVMIMNSHRVVMG